MLTLIKLLSLSALLMYGLVANVIAEEVPEEEKSRVNERLDKKGERIQEHLDMRGDHK